MPISKEKLPHSSGSAGSSNTSRVSRKTSLLIPGGKASVSRSSRPSGISGVARSSRPSGVAGTHSSSRPSGVDGRTYTDAATLSDEMGYGRIVKIVKAIPR